MSDEEPPGYAGYDLEVDPDEVRTLIREWLDVRERLDQIRRTHALGAGEFLAPGTDRVSKQMVDRLQEAVDNGDGSLRSALGIAMEQIRIQADLMTTTLDRYVAADTNARERMEHHQP